MDVTVGALVRPGHFLERELVEAELAPQQLHLFGAGIADVEPQPALLLGEQLAEAVDADLHRPALVTNVKHKPHRSHGAPSRVCQ